MNNLSKLYNLREGTLSEEEYKDSLNLPAIVLILDEPEITNHENLSEENYNGLLEKHHKEQRKSVLSAIYSGFELPADYLLDNPEKRHSLVLGRGASYPSSYMYLFDFISQWENLAYMYFAHKTFKEFLDGGSFYRQLINKVSRGLKKVIAKYPIYLSPSLACTICADRILNELEDIEEFTVSKFGDYASEKLLEDYDTTDFSKTPERTYEISFLVKTPKYSHQLLYTVILRSTGKYILYHQTDLGSYSIHYT